MLSEELKKRHPRLYAWLMKKSEPIIISCFFCSQESKHLRHEYTNEWISLPVCYEHLVSERKQLLIEQMCAVINEALNRMPNLASINNARRRGIAK